MNVVRSIINAGTNFQIDPVYNKHIRFTNSVALIVWCFAVENACVALYYRQSLIALVFLLHSLLIALMPIFNSMGKRVLASAWFSCVAILFVTFYSITFTFYSYDFLYLPMIIFLQFFLFSGSEKMYIIVFTAISVLCFAAAIGWHDLGLKTFITVSAQFIEAQKLNSFTGLPILSIAFGLYAFSAINRAEQEAAAEKEKTEQLLLSILPRPVAERFKNDRSLLAEAYQSVTVLFADIVGFTSLSEKITADELVKFLNDIFSRFDECTEVYGLEKIKTIGDAYMVAGGVPISSGSHAVQVCRMALKMQEIIRELKDPTGSPVYVRIGIGTGPATAGVIGVKKFIYDLWGDTVNTASRMESHSEPGNIQITEEVYNLVKNEFDCKVRGDIVVKGKGTMTTYFLTGAKP